jgi:Tol biopolymer transport system component
MLRRYFFVPAFVLVAVLAVARADDAAKERLFVVSMEGGPDKITIVSMNVDGSGRITIKTGEGMALDPALSPDGKRLAYTLMDLKTKRAEILVANADGSDAKKITAAEEKEIACGVSWSPDGKRLAYSVMKVPENGPPSNIALMVGDADGKNAKKFSEGMMPVWSPNGKRILYTVLTFAGDFDPHLYIMDADGKNAKELIKGKSMMGSYSPNGKRIVYMGAEKAKEGPGAQPHIHICNADGTEPKQITDGEKEFELAPRWSADGKRIFFNRMNRPDGPMMKMPLFVMDADGQNVKRIGKEDGADLLGGSSLWLLMRGSPQEAK